MKLIDVEYTFDSSKLLFYFTADGRIDFRELVKDLAAIYKTRIELRQIGVRDEVKMLGGYGMCGRELCCCNHLSDLNPVSIKMAKEQNLEIQILQAAEELFLSNGFAGTSTTDIAKRVGCNQALVHYYFRTKENLFLQ